MCSGVGPQRTGVVRISQSSKLGCPDLLIGFQGKTYLIEVKKDSKAKFTPQQLQFNELWTGGIIARIESIDEALALLKV